MKYELVNNDGCIMDSISTTSFKLARDYFKSKFEGSYKIVSSNGIIGKNEIKKVRL